MDPLDLPIPATRGEAAKHFTTLHQAAKALFDKGENMTGDDVARFDKLTARADKVKAVLAQFPDRAAAKAKLDAQTAFATTAVPPGGLNHAGATKADDGRVDNGESEMDKYLLKGPFKSLGHHAWELAKHGGREPGRVREGVLGEWNDAIAKYDSFIKANDVKATASGLSELADSEGASFVPVDLASGVWQRSMEQENLLARLNAIPVVGNALSVNAYADDSRADGSRMGGVLGYWLAEAAQLTKSKPTTRKIDLKLHKLAVLVWGTEELLDDSPMALDAEISRLASGEFTFKINDALVRGLGVGMPLGYLNSAAKVTQATGTGQAANTIVATNVDNMWARRAKPNGADYLWLANQDTEIQLAQLNYQVGTSGVAATWLYLPQGGITNAPTPQLKGRPVIFIEQAESVGTEGDLSLIDFSQWVAIVKSTGIKQTVSMHLRFDYDETAFKFTFRMDAKPRWEKALTRYKGANALSPIVTLSSTRN